MNKQIQIFVLPLTNHKHPFYSKDTSRMLRNSSAGSSRLSMMSAPRSWGLEPLPRLPAQAATLPMTKMILRPAGSRLARAKSR